MDEYFQIGNVSKAYRALDRQRTLPNSSVQKFEGKPVAPF
jgi:hypothetical protein